MLKWLKKLREAMIRPHEGPSVDPAEELGDPLAGKAEWTPCKRGGANFRTHKVVAVSAHRLEIRMTLGMWLFAGVFALIGIGVIVGGAFACLAESAEGPMWLMFPFGLVFGGVGVGLLYFAGKPRVFDRQAGYYWKGWRNPNLMNSAELEASDDVVRLEDIHALQIISEYCSGDDSSYYSYELNLVRKDASRINVTDHGKYDRLRQDAEMLAQLLDVPIWEL